ncbi:MAG: hypothetical protein F9K43_01765 [Bauldia sp.]|nr:MAG: hypothetical protein F9K43_01765 [Bauldia sp.]
MHSSSIDFDTVTQGLRTKSEKIRALAREGAATADIARYLGIRYQHARNVLVGSGLHTRRDDRNLPEPAAGGGASHDAVAWLRIDALGRLQVPPDLLRAGGIAGDESVYVRAGADGIEILSRRAALKRAHEIAKRFVPDGASLVEELIAERRRAASFEDE